MPARSAGVSGSGATTVIHPSRTSIWMPAAAACCWRSRLRASSRGSGRSQIARTRAAAARAEALLGICRREVEQVFRSHHLITELSMNW